MILQGTFISESWRKVILNKDSLPFHWKSDTMSFPQTLGNVWHLNQIWYLSFFVGSFCCFFQHAWEMELSCLYLLLFVSVDSFIFLTRRQSLREAFQNKYPITERQMSTSSGQTNTMSSCKGNDRKDGLCSKFVIC